MFTKKRFSLLVAAAALLSLALVACQPQVVEVEVTRVVTETVTEVVEGEEVVVEVTRVITEVVEADHLYGSGAGNPLRLWGEYAGSDSRLPRAV